MSRRATIVLAALLALLVFLVASHLGAGERHWPPSLCAVLPCDVRAAGGCLPCGPDVPVIVREG